MTQDQISGNIAIATRRFIDHSFEGSRLDIVWARVPEAIRESMPDLRRGRWYDREVLSAMWAAVADEYDDESQKAAALRRCGKFVGTDATSTFLRLVVKLLNPKIFAAKVPAFWKKDFHFGAVHVENPDFGAGRLEIVVDDVDNLAYFGHVAVGWFGHALEAMGEKDVRVELTEPGVSVSTAATWRFTVSWTP